MNTVLNRDATPRREIIPNQEAISQRVFRATTTQVEKVILEGELLDTTDLKTMSNELATLLGISQGETLQLLGISASTKSRTMRVSTEALDRAVSVLGLVARVAKLIGPNVTNAWLTQPKKALGGATPLELARSRTGLTKVGDVLDALEDGAYL